MIEVVKQYIKEEIERLKDVNDIISQCSDNDIIGCVAEKLDISREEAVEALGVYRTVAWHDDDHYTFEVNGRLYRYALNIDNDDPDTYIINKDVSTSEYYYLLKSDGDGKDFIYDLESDILYQIYDVMPYMYYNYYNSGIYGSEEYVDYLNTDTVTSLYAIGDYGTEEYGDEIDSDQISMIVWPEDY